MAKEPCFIIDVQGKYFTPAPGNIITGNDLDYLLGVLCSKASYFALRKFYMGGGIEGELKTNRLLIMPIPKILKKEQESIISNVRYIYSNKLSVEETKTLESKIDQFIYQIYRFNEQEIKYIEGI